MGDDMTIYHGTPSRPWLRKITTEYDDVGVHGAMWTPVRERRVLGLSGGGIMMMKFINCTDCGFKGEVDEYNVAGTEITGIDYCSGCGKQLKEEDL